jgi:hypothetical protein
MSLRVHRPLKVSSRSPTLSCPPPMTSTSPRSPARDCLEGGIRTVHFARVADLTDPAALSRVLGPIECLERTKIGPLGHSGATHERLDVALQHGDRVALILKTTRPSQDWAAVCTRDQLGREAQLLQAPALADVDWPSWDRSGGGAATIHQSPPVLKPRWANPAGQSHRRP